MPSQPAFILKGDNMTSADMGMGRSPLIIAADYGQSDVIKLLLEKGGNINVNTATFSHKILI